MRHADHAPPPLHPASLRNALRVLPLTIRHWLTRAGSLLPGACVLCCASGRHVLCDGCRAQFFSVRPARCQCCALPLASVVDDTRRCGACQQLPPEFDATIAVTDYAAPVERLVLGLKFGGRLAVAPLLAELLRDALLAETNAHRSRHGAARPSLAPPPLPDLLCPVPLGPARLRERGFNQALEIARPLARALGVPVMPRLLVRVRDTPPQSSLSPEGRRFNLRDAFMLQPALHAAVDGRHVGVVDDVMTTGETLGEIAALLRRFGAVRVTNLVFARTRPA